MTKRALQYLSLLGGTAILLNKMVCFAMDGEIVRIEGDNITSSVKMTLLEDALRLINEEPNGEIPEEIKQITVSLSTGVGTLAQLQAHLPSSQEMGRVLLTQILVHEKNLMEIESLRSQLVKKDQEIAELQEKLLSYAQEKAKASQVIREAPPPPPPLPVVNPVNTVPPPPPPPPSSFSNISSQNNASITLAELNAVTLRKAEGKPNATEAIQEKSSGWGAIFSRIGSGVLEMLKSSPEQKPLAPKPKEELTGFSAVVAEITKRKQIELTVEDQKILEEIYKAMETDEFTPVFVPGLKACKTQKNKLQDALAEIMAEKRKSMNEEEGEDYSSDWDEEESVDESKSEKLHIEQSILSKDLQKYKKVRQIYRDALGIDSDKKWTRKQWLIWEWRHYRDPKAREEINGKVDEYIMSNISEITQKYGDYDFDKVTTDYAQGVHLAKNSQGMLASVMYHGPEK